MPTDQRTRPTRPSTSPTKAEEEATSATMSAIVHDEFGEAADVVRLEQVPRPTAGAGEVLVRVIAASVDRGVWHIMRGLPYAIRLAGYGVRRPKHRVLGAAMAGVVEAVGADVADLRVGDEVYGIAEGAYATYARARADRVAPKPTSLTFEEAAAVPDSAIAALQAVRDRGNVQAGQAVLVLGASGGVGTFAVQIAKALGAQVTGVASGPKLDLVRSLGADHVIDYAVADSTSDESRYDVIVDIGGNTPIAALRRALAPRGTLVITGGETDGRWLGGTDRQLRAMVLSPFVGQKLGTFVASPNTADLKALTELIDAGQVSPVVDRTYPLADAAVAIAHLAEGHAKGKLVLNIG